MEKNDKIESSSEKLDKLEENYQTSPEKENQKKGITSIDLEYPKEDLISGHYQKTTYIAYANKDEYLIVRNFRGAKLVLKNLTYEFSIEKSKKNN